MKENQPNIIVVGGLNIDLFMNVPKLPVLGETIKGSNFFQTPGGKGANQAVACARLGGNVTMFGKTGNDSFSELLINNLNKSGINTEFIEQAEDHTGVALIMVDKEANNLISFAPGANNNLSTTDIDRYKECFSKQQTLLIQNECRMETIVKSVELAKQNDLKIIYNPAPALDIDDDFIKKCDVIIPNETEAETLSGISISDDKSLEKIADFFINKGCETVIITLGEKGAFYKSNKEIGVVKAPTVKAIDTVAAGDTFLGAFTVEYSKDKPIQDCIRFATHAAAISVTKSGAQTSIPMYEDVYNTYPILRSSNEN